MESNLVNILDDVNKSLMEDYPELNESQAAFRTTLINLQVLIANLIDFGMSGEDLPNQALANVVQGLIDTVEWMVAKDQVDGIVKSFEEELDSNSPEDPEQLSFGF